MAPPSLPAPDPELLAIFRSEAEGHLRALGDGFLSLERRGQDAGALDEMFRAAHSLKGAARMMGFPVLEEAAHRLEDLLDRLRKGKLALGPEDHDRLSRVLEALAGLLERTLAQQPGEELAERIRAELEACLDPAKAAAPPPKPELPKPQPPPPPPPPKAEAPWPAPTPPPPAPVPAPAPVPQAASLEILRVPVGRLDQLVNQVSELMELNQRVARRAEEAQRLAEGLPGGPREVQGQTKALALALREDAGRMDTLMAGLETAVRRTRLVPLAALFEAAPRWVRDLARETGKAASLELRGGELEVDKRLIEGLRDPLLHLIRNAVDHGLESPAERQAAGKAPEGRLLLSASRAADGVVIRLEDDGRGIDAEAIRRSALASGRLDAAGAEALGTAALWELLFEPGFSTRREVSSLSGRGVGLDLVRNQVEALRGRVRLESRPGAGTAFELQLPLSLASLRVLLVEAGGLRLGVPSAAVATCRILRPRDRVALEGREGFLDQDGSPLVVHGLAALLGRPERRPGPQEPLTVLVLESAAHRFALAVDALLGEAEVVQKPLPARVRKLPALSGLALLGDGGLCYLLQPGHLERASRQGGLPSLAPAPPLPSRPRVLVAEDSITTRIQLQRILEAEGFQVSLAVDGLDAWSQLGARAGRPDAFQALVSDVEMPGMTGFELTGKVRAQAATAELPVVLLTSLARPEDQRRGLDLGASAYLTKGSFDQTELVAALRRLT